MSGWSDAEEGKEGLWNKVAPNVRVVDSAGNVIFEGCVKKALLPAFIYPNGSDPVARELKESRVWVDDPATWSGGATEPRYPNGSPVGRGCLGSGDGEVPWVLGEGLFCESPDPGELTSESAAGSLFAGSFSIEPAGLC